MLKKCGQALDHHSQTDQKKIETVCQTQSYTLLYMVITLMGEHSKYVGQFLHAALGTVPKLR